MCGSGGEVLDWNMHYENLFYEIREKDHFLEILKIQVDEIILP